METEAEVTRKLLVSLGDVFASEESLRRFLVESLRNSLEDILLEYV